MDLSSLLVFCLGLLTYFQAPSRGPLAVPIPGLTGFGAGHCHSSGTRPDAHSSRPSAHRWCRWHCRGSQGWASRLKEEMLRGQHALHPHLYPLNPWHTHPSGLCASGGLSAHKSLALKSTPSPGIRHCLPNGLFSCLRTHLQVPGLDLLPREPVNPKVRD